MKQILKRRIAIMLSLLLVLPSVINLLPMAELQAEAATISLNWDFNTSKELEVEEGQAFYVGDYVNVYGGKETATASMVKASYKSSDTAIATVTSKGYMETLTPGVTTITIKYKGKTLSHKFRVVSKGTFGESEAITKLQEAASTIPSKMPNKITTKNGFGYQNLISNYMKVEEELKNDIGGSGLLKELYDSGWGGSFYTSTNKLAVPTAGRKRTLRQMLVNYAEKNNPTATRGAKGLKVSSATASVKKNCITLNFKNKVTKEQILAAQIFEKQYYSSMTPPGNIKNKQAYVRAYVYDKNAVYYGVVLITEGKKTGKMQLYQYKYTADGTIAKKVKIKSGHTYQLGRKTVEWTNGRKVKAK